jgi:hypothetical protein
MQHEALSDSLSRSAFEFFFWFSRFEAALKEASFLKSEKEGAAAEPDWELFVAKYADDYEITASGKKLVELAPERQKVGPGRKLVWRPVGLADCKNDLCKVVRLLKTLRNNVFHGGKSGGAGWDQPERTAELLEAGKSELHCLAVLAGIQADLWQRY